MDDEMMLRVIGNVKYDSKIPANSDQITKCKIYDARNYYAALGNKLQGKGFEST